jgi:hypothetical protein
LLGKVLAVGLVFLPIAGPFATLFIRSGLNLLLLVYSVILNVLSLMGVHSISSRKAVAVIIIQVVLLAALIVALVVFAGILIDRYLSSLL